MQWCAEHYAQILQNNDSDYCLNERLYHRSEKKII